MKKISNILKIIKKIYKLLSLEMVKDKPVLKLDNIK
jgi:hypothetical protein